MKRKISLILASLLVLSCLILPVSAEGSIPSAPAIPTTGAVWDGTTEEFTSEDLVQIGDLYYYEISNAEQLAFLAETGGDWLTYNYILTTNIILNDVKLEWDADGTLTTENVLEWTPIYDFKGIFDGNGYTIKNLTVDSSAQTGEHYSSGLFGWVEGKVTIKNVKISAGAGFIVVLTGDIMTMPGLPKVPAAEKIDVDENGKIVGLF